MNKKKHIIRFHPVAKEIQVNDQTPLIDVLHEFGVEFPCGGKGTCGKCKIRMLEGAIEVTKEHREKLDASGLKEDWRLACMSTCTSDITLEIGQFSHIILADETEFHFTPRTGFGVAVDLGTTTLVTQLIDLNNSRVLAVETALNPQVRYGADLITRIQSCLDGKAHTMKNMVRSAIGVMINRMSEKHAVELKKVVLVGNTAMQLIFSGQDVSPLAMYPFSAGNIGLKHFKPEELGWVIPVSEGVWFYPSIGSFVGSDILAGIVATGLHQKEEYTALIDLGTNGEIAMGNRDRIVCASTAAGPAFEGANISMGMRAVTGAISSFELQGDHMVGRIIGNTQPKGICGSALIDAVTLLRKMEKIGIFGEIISGDGMIALMDNIYLTQKDINEFQLAKAALATGIKILSKKLSIKTDQIKELYIAGAFGNYINLRHATETGMIEVRVDKIHKMGNTALIGAKMFLFENKDYTEEILQKTTHVNLEADPEFQDIFVDKMLL